MNKQIYQHRIGNDLGKHRIRDELGKYRQHKLVKNTKIEQTCVRHIRQPLKSNNQGRHILQHDFIEDTLSYGRQTLGNFPKKTLNVYCNRKRIAPLGSLL